MTSITNWFQQLNFSSLLNLVIVVAASLLCIILHECAHGVVALWLGDRTAKNMGRLTLNPIKHIDLVGLIMMAVAHVGWAKPVPIDPRNFKNPKWGMALTALAGPICNFLLALVAGMIYLIFDVVYRQNNSSVIYYLEYFFFYVTMLSTGLGIFNLIPISPLDGSKVLLAFLPEKAYFSVLRYEKYGMFLLIALVLALDYLPGLGSPLQTVIESVMNALLWVAKYPAYAIISLLYPGVYTL